MLRMLDFAWRWTVAVVPWRGFETTMTTLRACHAFDTDEQADRVGTRLMMPSGPCRGGNLTAPRNRTPLRHNTVRVACSQT